MQIYSEIWESLVKSWNFQGIEINSGVSEEYLKNFEIMNQIRLPEEMRSYFTFVNGMKKGSIDDEMFYFYPLEEVNSFAKEQRISSEFRLQGKKSFIFADYCFGANVFFIDILDIGFDCPIYALGIIKPVRIADSFKEFIEKYLIDKHSLI
jgi:hypothetical protein